MKDHRNNLLHRGSFNYSNFGATEFGILHSRFISLYEVTDFWPGLTNNCRITTIFLYSHQDLININLVFGAIFDF